MSFTKFLIEKEIKKYQNAFLINMVNMQNEIVYDTPVDTGRLKTSWKYLPIDKKRFEFKMFNNTEYAGIIWAGRRTIGGKTVGSTKGWGLQGGDVVVQKHLQKMLTDFKKIANEKTVA